MSKDVLNSKIKLKELDINLSAANKDGDVNFIKKFSKLPKKAQGMIEKTNQQVLVIKDELKKIDLILKPGSSTTSL